MSIPIRKLLLGASVLTLAQLAQAQITVITATPVAPSDAVAASGQAPVDHSQTSGAPAAQGATAAGAGVPVMVVPSPTESVTSNPATDGSNDPYIQNRKARAQAKADYKARVQAAKSEYRQDKREARSDYRQDRREDYADLRAANRAMPRVPLEGPLTLTSGR